MSCLFSPILKLIKRVKASLELKWDNFKKIFKQRQLIVVKDKNKYEHAEV